MIRDPDFPSKSHCYVSWLVWVSPSAGGISHGQEVITVIHIVSTNAGILGSGHVIHERYLVPCMGSSQRRGRRHGKEAEKTMSSGPFLHVVSSKSLWQLAFVVGGAMRRGDRGMGSK